MYRSRKLALAIFASTFIMGLTLCPFVAGQQPANPPYVGYTGLEQIDRKAAATDPAGVHAYSLDLIRGIVNPDIATYPEPPNKYKDLIDSLSNRLANAEQAAREGKGKLVPEGDVARAFNELMRRTGAPSYTSDEADIHRFRVHAAELSVLQYLFTAGRNGTNCNPGEAVYLVSLLIGGNGKLPLHELDLIVQFRRSWEGIEQGKGTARNELRMVPYIKPQGAAAVTLSYSQRHYHATSKLFNDFAITLGF